MRVAAVIVALVMGLAAFHTCWKGGSADRAVVAAVEGDAGALGQEIRQGIPVDLRDEGGRTLLMLAAERGRLSTVQALLESGANANAVTATGWSALAAAVAAGHEPVVYRLLLAGADPAAQVGEGFVIADVARMHGRGAIATLLVSLPDSPKSHALCIPTGYTD